MSDRLQKWTAFLVALGSIAGAVATGLQSATKQEADFSIVSILAQQLAESQAKAAEAGRRCP